MKNTLAGYWPLYETSGSTANDLSGNGKDGTINGAGPAGSGTTVPSGTPSPPQSSVFFFDGNNDNVEISDETYWDGVSEGTISAWVRSQDILNADTDAVYLVSKNPSGTNNNEVQFFFDSSTPGWKLSGRDNSGTFLSATYDTTVSANVWHHVVCTWSSTTGVIRIYQNGVEGTSDSTSNNIHFLAADTPLEIGSFRGQSNVLHGFMGDVRIYDRALTPNEVAYLYEVGRRGRAVTSVKSL